MGHRHGRESWDMAGNQKLHCGPWHHHLTQLAICPSYRPPSGPYSTVVPGLEQGGKKTRGSICWLVCLLRREEAATSMTRSRGHPGLLEEGKDACCWPSTRLAVWWPWTRQPGGLAAHPGHLSFLAGAPSSAEPRYTRGHFGHFSRGKGARSSQPRAAGSSERPSPKGGPD